MHKPRTKEPGSTVADETRERILRGASRAFGKLGYADTRVEDVLLASGVSRPTFYKAYEGKDAVFDALSERHHQDIRQRILKAIEDVGDPSGQIEAAIDAFMRWRAELGPMGRVLDAEARTPGSRLGRHRKKTLAEMAELIAARTAAVGNAATDSVLYYGLIAAMEHIADLLLSRHPVPEAAIARAKRNALRLFIATLAGPADVVPPLPPPP